MKKYSDVFLLAICVGLLLLLNVVAASASFISLNSVASARVEKNTLKVSILATNRGDEPAYNVQAEIKAAGKELLADKKTELGINQTYQAEETFNLPFTKPGTYPLIIIMHYTDANQYPFSALISQTYVFQKDTVAPVFGQLNSTAFSKKGELAFLLKNLSGDEIKVSTRLVAPRELTVNENAKEISLASKSEQKLTFPAKNFSALSGSTYQVFALSEVEDKSLHSTSISPGTVKIISNDKILGLDYTLIFVILFVLILFFIAIQFLTNKKS